MTCLKVLMMINIFVSLAMGMGRGKKLTISAISGLEFGELVQGDPIKVIQPGTRENPYNASFLVSGKRYTTYSIILPTSSQLSFSGGGDFHLIISNFQSYPPEGFNGLLNRRGKQRIYVGASIGPLSFSQPSGNYSGDFVIEVIY